MQRIGVCGMAGPIKTNKAGSSKKGEAKMRSIVHALTLRLRRKRRRKIVPLELHRLPWHPLFYKAVSLHIDSTTQQRRFQ